jgi:hypothetical protein
VLSDVIIAVAALLVVSIAASIVIGRTLRRLDKSLLKSGPRAVPTASSDQTERDVG